MHPKRKKKLNLILLFATIIGLILALVLYALRQNISLFYTPSDIAANKVPLHQRIRVGGVVLEHSVVRGSDGLSVAFKITDYKNVVEVNYRGILPDLFRESKGIVVQGSLTDSNHFNAAEVLAKHDENYMPPEVRKTLQKARV